MKLLESIKQFFAGLSDGQKIHDPVFGPLYWDSDWWYVNHVFAPTGKEIGVSIVTEGQPPDDRHRALYSEIESRYPLLQDTIVDALFETLLQEFKQHSRHLLDRCRRDDLWKQLRHEGLCIESVASQPRQWSLSYYCGWSDCVYDIHMADWSVAKVENIGG